jgi:phage tail sheath protein FI
MPEYLYPGVYIEEGDTGNKPIEGVSTSTVGFLGITERGPLQPMLVTSFSDYTKIFGTYVTGSYLAYAVEGFFQNGGERCFVMRVAGVTAPANTSISDFGMRISAVGPGAWGNNIVIQIVRTGSPNSSLFRLLVAYWSDGVPDVYTNQSPPRHTLPDLTQALPANVPAPTLFESFGDLSRQSAARFMPARSTRSRT